MDDNISFINKVTESSPVIVLVLLAGYLGAGKIIHMLIARLDKKDDQIIKMNMDTTAAIHSLAEAVQEQTHAVQEQTQAFRHFERERKI